jgi:hypothetical protein
MRMYHYRLDEKLDVGRLSGLRKLSLDEAPPQDSFVILHTAPGGLPRHISAYSEGAVLREDIRILVVSQDPHAFTAEHVQMLAGRGQVIPWGLETIDVRQRHVAVQWKVSRLARFLAKVAEIDRWNGGREPPWELLEAPRAPEDLLACYIAVSLGQRLAEAWKIAALSEYQSYGEATQHDPLDFSKEGLARAIVKVGGAVYVAEIR